MKAFRLIIALGWICPIAAIAQSVPSDSGADPVLDAIREFNERQAKKPNEVTVVLDPPTAPAPAPVIENPPVAPPEPARVTEPTPEKSVEPPVAAQDGLTVDVEKLQSGQGVVQTGQIKLLAPFPAKPLSGTPVGWKLDPAADVPLMKKEVELSSGKKIILTIRPHLLVPDVDGATSFSIRETGYDPALGYQQSATVGAILSQSIQQLDEESKQLGAAIDNLQQLLVSLPMPEAEPPAPEPAAPPKPAKR